MGQAESHEPLVERYDLEATLAEGERRRAASSDPLGEFPLPNWDRFRPLRFLGQGGMGRVFLVRDVRLQRDVALKLVRDGDPELARRFLFEARAQARVSHERVCKVYEVGEVEGRVYIAMEYIDGKPLSALVETLTIEQKVLLLRGAAHGVNEAHRVGLIHRDLKPANILVAEGADGSLAPYVLDFGLARSIHESTTLSGAVLGTPHFMAPEQARGESSSLDRRTDVYALGATLYHLLSGEAPIPGTNPLEVLAKVAMQEPRPLRSLVPNVPVDLEAIVHRCLEKERSLRYDSARALADDLDRFLAGEPVHARPTTPTYRAKKWLTRHRRIAAVVGVAAIAVLVALGWAIVERRDASERERLARHYAEIAERFEARTRYSDLSPLHDVRATRAAIRTELDELSKEIAEAGGVALGPGEDALGRGFLALGEDAEAREHLDAAWSHGLHTPSLAYERALVMGRLYQQGLRDAERSRSANAREEKIARLRRELRDPVLALLSESLAQAAPSSDYVAALIAFYEDRFDDALAHLDRLGAKIPWFYEAPRLRGDVLLGRALAAEKAGRHEASRADLDRARAAYLAAAAIGESAPAVHRALGELEQAALTIELYGEGVVAPPFERGLAAVERALAADPDDYASWLLAARLHRGIAEQRSMRGLPTDELLTKAVARAERAIELRPKVIDAKMELALIHQQWGDDMVTRGLDPREHLARAVELVEGIDEVHRDADYHLLLGLTRMLGADWAESTGADPGAERDRAIAAYQRAIELDPSTSNAWINLGANQLARARRAKREDQPSALEQAAASFERARALSPKNVAPCFYGGEIEVTLAVAAREDGRDPRPALARARALYEAGLAIDPQSPQLLNGLGGVHAELARAAWDRGDDPAPFFVDAEAAYRRAISAAPAQSFAYNNLGALFAQRAVMERLLGKDPSATLAAGVRALEAALQRTPDSATYFGNLSVVHALAAGALLERGRDPTPSVKAAERAIAEALKRDPKEPMASLYRGEVRSVLARSAARAGRARAEDFEAAARTFEAALADQPDNRDERLLFGEHFLAWARSASPNEVARPLERGRALAEKLLGLRPKWAEALLLRGRLALVAAEHAEGKSNADVERAREDLASAVRMNGNLAKHAAPELASVERLGGRTLDGTTTATASSSGR